MFVQKHQQTWDSWDIYNRIFHVPRWSCTWQAFQMTLILYRCEGENISQHLEVLQSFMTVMKVSNHILKGFSPFPTPHLQRTLESHYICTLGRGAFVFSRLFLPWRKRKKDFQNHVHSKAFKKTLSWKKKETKASFHYYYYYYKILALFHITGILKNCHH